MRRAQRTHHRSVRAVLEEGDKLAAAFECRTVDPVICSLRRSRVQRACAQLRLDEATAPPDHLIDLQPKRALWQMVAGGTDRHV